MSRVAGWSGTAWVRGPLGLEPPRTERLEWLSTPTLDASLRPARRTIGTAAPSVGSFRGPGEVPEVPDPGGSDVPQQTAARAAHGFGHLQCQECAEAVQRAVAAVGGRGQIIELRGGGQRGFIISKSLPPTATAISRNGRHVGVRVGHMVFDKLRPEGMPFDRWIADFDALGGVRVPSITDF
jgi:hypothetical protein